MSSIGLVCTDEHLGDYKGEFNMNWVLNDIRELLRILLDVIMIF